MTTLGFVDELDLSKIRWADVDSVRTRYYEAGQGEPLVLIHGGDFGFIDALDTSSLNLTELSNNFHVFAVDKFGQGHTDVPKGMKTTRMMQFCATYWDGWISLRNRTAPT